MNLKFSVILAFLFAALIRSEDTSNNTTNGTCTDDLQCSTCQCIDSNDPIAIGDTITICAQYVTVNQTTGCITAYRGVFPVQVDTFSAIQVNGSQGYFQNYGYVNIVVQAFGTVKSLPLTYLQQSQFYSNKFSIVIQVSGGVVQSLIWDHQCATCSSSDCYKFTLSNGTLIDTICNDQSCLSASDPTCDTQIYVTWVGSDKNGNKLTSAGMRLSRFEQFSISQLLDSKTIPAYVMPNNTNTTNTTVPTTPNNTDTTHTNTTEPTTPNNTDTTHTNTTEPTTPNNTDTTHTNTTNTTEPTTHTNTTEPTTPNNTDTTHTNTTNTTEPTTHTNTTEPTTHTNTTNTTEPTTHTDNGTGTGTESGSGTDTSSGKDTSSTGTTGSDTSSGNTSGSGSDTSGKTETDTKDSTSTSTDDKSQTTTETTETADHSSVAPIKTL